MKTCNFIKIGLHRGCFPRNFPKFQEQLFCYLWTAISGVSLYLHRYFPIFPIHVHLNDSKSYGCSQVSLVIGIDVFHNYLIAFIFFYMQTWSNVDW